MRPEVSLDASSDDGELALQSDRSSDGDDSASLDTMIFNFRASSHFNSTADELVSRASRGPQALRSAPSRTSHLKTRMSADRPLRSQQQACVTKPRTVSKAPAPRGRPLDSDDSGQENEVVRPMPKLTQVPKPKPSLVQLPRSRLLEISKPAASSREPVTTRATSLLRTPPSTRLQRPRPPPTPVLVPTKAESTSPSAMSTPSPHSSLSSPQATSTSSDLSASDALGDSSVDSLIGNDINELSRLISSAHDMMRGNTDEAARTAPPARHSPTSDEVTAALAQKTRFRTGTFDFGSRAAATAATKKASQELVCTSPRFLMTAKKLAGSVLRLPAQRQHRQHHDGDGDDKEEARPPPPLPPLDDEGDAIGTEDSFAEEIARLRRTARKERDEREKARRVSEQKRAAAAAAASPEPKEISEETTANIRAVSNAIDEALLLALQPLERRRKELDREEAADAIVTASEVPAEAPVPWTLPLATQAIVEQLDLAFGSMTEQRNAELKAAEEAAAAAKAAQDAATSAAEAKKQADERAEKQREMAILSFLPMRGRLMATSADVDDALLRLEQAENQAAHTLDFVAGRAAPIGDMGEPSLAPALADELAKLQQIARQRMQTIERRLEAPLVLPPPPQPQRVDWTRSAFEEQGSTSARLDPAATAYTDGSNDRGVYDEHVPFHDILQQQVVEKLDLTILRLRHVLSIDAKEAEEAKLARAREENAQQAKQLREDAEKVLKKQELEDAAAARRRVMGLSSLEQVHAWVNDDDDYEGERLIDSLSNARALERLATSLDIQASKRFALSPSCFDTHEAIAQFNAIKMAACGRAREVQPESPSSGGSQYSEPQVSVTSSNDSGAAAGAAPVHRRVQFAPRESTAADPSLDTFIQRFRRMDHASDPDRRWELDNARRTPPSRLSQRTRTRARVETRPEVSSTHGEHAHSRSATRSKGSGDGGGSAVVARVQQQLAQLQAERRRKQSAWRATTSAR